MKREESFQLLKSRMEAFPNEMIAQIRNLMQVDIRKATPRGDSVNSKNVAETREVREISSPLLPALHVPKDLNMSTQPVLSQRRGSRYSASKRNL